MKNNRKKTKRKSLHLDSIGQNSNNLHVMISIGVGAILVIAQIWSWGEFSVKDLLGHEWLGLLLIVGGIIANLNFKTPWSKELIKIINKIKGG